jgi:hypothetical protein
MLYNTEHMTPFTQQAHEWLRRRTITETIIQDFNIHCDTHASLGECIVIPVNDPKGNHVFNKYRRDPMIDIKPKYTTDYGGSAMLYGADRIAESDIVVITEGEMDCLVLWSHNIPAVSSTGGSMTFKEDWVQYLKGKEIYICYDNDNAGAEGMVRVLSFMPAAKVIFIPETPGVKDISDYVARGGNFHDLMRSARCYSNVSDVEEDRKQRMALWLPVRFHDEYLQQHYKPLHTEQPRRTVKDTRNTDDVSRAKEVPIDRYIKFDGYGKARCLWHSDKTPSMHYYRNKNKVFCFGCGKSADVIDVVRELDGCTFIEAVRKLNN